MEDLFNVHQAVAEAQQEHKTEYQDQPMITFTFRLHESTREIADEVLKTNGITLSQFCRKCVEGLIKDYKP